MFTKFEDIWFGYKIEFERKINVISLDTGIFNRWGMVNGNAKVMIIADSKAAKDKAIEDKLMQIYGGFFKIEHEYSREGLDVNSIVERDSMNHLAYDSLPRKSSGWRTLDRSLKH